MIALLGPVSVPEGALTGSPWPAVLVLVLFVLAIALVAAWDLMPWTRIRTKKEPLPTEETYHPKAA